MVQALESALEKARTPDHAPPVRVMTVLRTGRVGRPAKIVHRDYCKTVLTTNLSKTKGARGATVSTRTLQRNMLRYGLVQSGAPVYTETAEENGMRSRIYTSSIPAMSCLTDQELDQLISNALDVYPSYGQKMLQGYLTSIEMRVSMARIRESYLRVHGPNRLFGPGSIHRREYRVKGAQSVWHHDGQLGACTQYEIE
jgi:hypothetical protein